MFGTSFNATLERYRKLLIETGEGTLQLPNDNFDVGGRTGPGQYRLNDEAHAKLLDELAEKKFAAITSELKTEILHFYTDPDSPYATKRHAKAWAKLQTELQQLRSSTTVASAQPAAPIP